MPATLSPNTTDDFETIAKDLSEGLLLATKLLKALVDGDAFKNDAHETVARLGVQLLLEGHMKLVDRALALDPAAI